MRRCFWVLAVLSWIFICSRSEADVLSVANSIRAEGCGRNPPVQALTADKKLMQAAQSVARGMSPHNAATAAGYQVTSLASIHLAGFSRDAELRTILSRHYCNTVVTREYRDLGVAQRGGEAWILFGASLKTPSNFQAASRRVLELVNEARSRARRCGAQKFVATTSLTLNSVLEKAALSHSQEMAKYSYLEHEGRNGSTPAERVTQAGYLWGHTGENIAAGPGAPEDVVAGWLSSPGHCANIMSPKFTEMGVAYALSKDDYGIYWTQVFGAPR